MDKPLIQLTNKGGGIIQFEDAGGLKHGGGKGLDLLEFVGGQVKALFGAALIEELDRCLFHGHGEDKVKIRTGWDSEFRLKWGGRKVFEFLIQ